MQTFETKTINIVLYYDNSCKNFSKTREILQKVRSLLITLISNNYDQRLTRLSSKVAFQFLFYFKYNIIIHTIQQKKNVYKVKRRNFFLNDSTIFMQFLQLWPKRIMTSLDKKQQFTYKKAINQIRRKPPPKSTKEH